MRYLEIAVATTTAACEAVSDILLSAGAAGVVIQDNADMLFLEQQQGDWDYMDVSLFDADESPKVTCYLPFDETLRARLEQIRHALEHLARQQTQDFPVGSLEMGTRSVSDEDWANTWKQYYKPIRVTERLTVVPVWEPYAPESGEIVLQLDPGMAFGTGQHATTFMCMQLIDGYVKPGAQVLDVGSGSGILSIASILLGARFALGTDIDSVAVKVAGENAKLNDIGSAVFNVMQGDLLRDAVLRDAMGNGYDLVISNIIADVIIRLAPFIDGFLGPDGVWIASGIIRDRLPDVLFALEAEKLRVVEKKEDEEWVALAIRRA